MCLLSIYQCVTNSLVPCKTKSGKLIVKIVVHIFVGNVPIFYEILSKYIHRSKLLPDSFNSHTVLAFLLPNPCKNIISLTLNFSKQLILSINVSNFHQNFRIHTLRCDFVISMIMMMNRS